ncbi:MAG: DUF1722 domain-containing protein [Candidatus Krumholzibacteriota bacterium]|nr:DUF1722 domain-containing protein [Candidatus Krumholzibacteriota bacterium]
MVGDKPKVVVSKCLEFASCRYNGLRISSPVVRLFQDQVDFLPVCPEVEIGLGIPRDPIRICEKGGVRALIQPSTGRDVTDAMRRFIETFFGSLGDVDGFILKGRSPSCGIRDVKLYSSAQERMHFGKGSGFFGAAAAERFPRSALEDEGRLTNFRIREHFLTQLYTVFRFRRARSSPSMRGIVKFQAEHKLLLMAYNQKEMRELGRIVANPERRPVEEVFELYGEHLSLALRKPPRHTSNINVLMHAFGYFSKRLSAQEKAFFLDSLERYRAEMIPLSALLYITRSWILRFGTEYLADQVYCAPYPETLAEITDSGKGRKL